MEDGDDMDIPRVFPECPPFMRCTVKRDVIVRIRIDRVPEGDEIDAYEKWYVALYDYYGYHLYRKFCLVFDIRDLEFPPLAMVLRKFQLTIDLEPRTLRQVVGAVIVTSKNKIVEYLHKYLFQRKTADQRYMTYDTADGTKWLKERMDSVETWALEEDWDAGVYDDSESE